MTENPDSGIVIIDESISRERVLEMAERFGDMVKTVVDTNRRLLALGGELHSDEQAALLALGSTHTDLWGINIYPDQQRSGWIEFDSLMNVRPRLGNRSRGVEDADRRRVICEIVDSLIR